MDKEHAVCRGCEKPLDGPPYYRGKPAFLPDGKQAKVNFYGGFVCSRDCDYIASKKLESSMPPGAGLFYSLSMCAKQSIKDNWRF